MEEMTAGVLAFGTAAGGVLIADGVAFKDLGRNLAKQFVSFASLVKNEVRQ